MVLVECVDHRGIDVVDGDTEHNDSHILADSRNEGSLVVHSYRHISVPRCESHLSFKGGKIYIFNDNILLSFTSPFGITHDSCY